MVVQPRLYRRAGAAIASQSGDRDSPKTRRRARIEVQNKYDDKNHEPTQEEMEELIVIDGTPEQIADALFSKGALKRSCASSNSDGGAGSAASSARR